MNYINNVSFMSSHLPRRVRENKNKRVKRKHIPPAASKPRFRFIIIPEVKVVCLFVCVEVLRASKPNGVMSSVVSLPNHTLLGRPSPLSS